MRAVGVPKACNLDLGNDSGDGERWIDKLEFGASNNPFTEGTQSLESMPHVLRPRTGNSRSKDMRKISGGVLGTSVTEEGEV